MLYGIILPSCVCKKDKDLPKGKKQKLKLCYLSQIMLQKTDDEHMITQPEIIEYLNECGVTVDRNTLYDDLHCLSEFGIDVIVEKMWITADVREGRQDEKWFNAILRTVRR